MDNGRAELVTADGSGRETPVIIRRANHDLRGANAVGLIGRAELTARSVFAGMPRRHRHSRGVAEKAESISELLPSADREVLVAAAWLHDVGHHPALDDNGFHALDGAKHLEGDFPDRVVSLVAHHSAARFEASRRGLHNELAAFSDEQSIVTAALTYCDMTTGPIGEPVELSGRLTDIALRYGPDHVVTRSLRAARPVLEAAILRVERELCPAATDQRSVAGPPAR